MIGAMRWLLVVVLLAGCTSLLGLSDVESVDKDNDGRFDAIDNCPNDYNPDQSDKDRNGIGDRCDGCLSMDVSDVDLDNIPDACDGCVGNFIDDDVDDIPDNCDACVDPMNQCAPCVGPDTDGDGIADMCECPMGTADEDGDGIHEGAAPSCDPCRGRNHDEDGDGLLECVECYVPGCRDACPRHPHTTNTPGNNDADGDGVDNACDLLGGAQRLIFDGFGAPDPSWYLSSPKWVTIGDAARIVAETPGATRSLGTALSLPIRVTTSVTLGAPGGDVAAGVFLALHPAGVDGIHCRVVPKSNGTGTYVVEVSSRSAVQAGTVEFAIPSPAPIEISLQYNDVGPTMRAVCRVTQGSASEEVTIFTSATLPLYPGLSAQGVTAAFAWYEALWTP